MPIQQDIGRAALCGVDAKFAQLGDIGQACVTSRTQDRIGGDWRSYGGLVVDATQENQSQQHHKILLQQQRYLRAGRQELVRFIAWVKEEFQQ